MFNSGELKLSPRAGCGRGGFKEDIGHYVRSSYEHAFARWLISRNLAYDYEPTRFNLPDTSYTPDFRIGLLWVEIKNSFNVDDPVFLTRFKLFLENYPDEKIIVVVGDQHDHHYDSATARLSSDGLDIHAPLEGMLCEGSK